MRESRKAMSRSVGSGLVTSEASANVSVYMRVDYSGLLACPLHEVM